MVGPSEKGSKYFHVRVKAQDDMEAADRQELQRVEALGYQPSW